MTMHARTGIALVLGLALGACHSAPKDSAGAAPAAAAQAAVKELSVATVASLVQTKAATIVDANNAETREKQGVVPGALLLSSSHDYALSELPAAKDTK